MFLPPTLTGAVTAALIVASSGATDSCAPPASSSTGKPAASQRHTTKPKRAATTDGKPRGKVLAAASSCTYVVRRNGDMESVCETAQGNPRTYPPYPAVRHAPGDKVTHLRHPAEWVDDSDAALADAARKAARDGWGRDTERHG